MYDTINLGRRIDVQWPNEDWRQKGGKNFWKDWVPEKGLEGQVGFTLIICVIVKAILYSIFRDNSIVVAAFSLYSSTSVKTLFVRF